MYAYLLYWNKFKRAASCYLTSALRILVMVLTFEPVNILLTLIVAISILVSTKECVGNWWNMHKSSRFFQVIEFFVVRKLKIIFPIVCGQEKNESSLCLEFGVDCMVGSSETSFTVHEGVMGKFVTGNIQLPLTKYTVLQN